MIWTLPNILTLLRLMAAPMLAVIFLYFNRPWADWFALMLFLGAAITDWFDGHLARSWRQTTRLGTMLDPIADKAMVIIALMVILGYSSTQWTPWLVLPATIIVFREVAVAGLREFLGSTADALPVTSLAKGKTTLQMIAIAVMFSQGVFEHYFDVFADRNALIGQRWAEFGIVWSARVGLVLLWGAALLTLFTGIDYFRKAWPWLKD